MKEALLKFGYIITVNTDAEVVYTREYGENDVYITYTRRIDKYCARISDEEVTIRLKDGVDSDFIINLNNLLSE